MCGIAGVFLSAQKTVEEAVLQKMSQRIQHRGPDGRGMWISPDKHVGFVHQRLSILDLSHLGSQPMSSPSGRFTITFNGEIYNYRELRKELIDKGFQFKSDNDTEVMLAAFEAWGIENATQKFIGMFAFAVWDVQTQQLFLVRDRVGIKPLYYAHLPDAILFASEPSAFLAYPNFSRNISAQGLAKFLQYGYLPGELSIFENVFKILPGQILIFNHGLQATQTVYWSIEEIIEKAHSEKIDATEDAAVNLLYEKIRDAVRYRLIADVPIGAFLSGGIDSSMIVAMMQELTPQPVKTFTIGFQEKAFDEAHYADKIAKHLGTDHTAHYLSISQAQEIITKLPDIYTEPFADVSQIPTFLVSQLARQQVTVVLSGDGGDELFGGYNRYVFVSRFWKNLQKMPLGMRTLFAKTLQSLNPNTWNQFFYRLNHFTKNSFPPLMGDKLHKIAGLLKSKNLYHTHDLLNSLYPYSQRFLNQEIEIQSLTHIKKDFLEETQMFPLQQMYWDSKTYLVDDILTKVDRATMHVGLEARVPLLDHRLFAFAWQLPLNMRIKDNQGKWLLKKLLSRYIPNELIERPKQGFGVPIEEWLRGPLRSLAEDYFSLRRIRQEGYLDGDFVQEQWQAHLSGRVNRGGILWAVLMFQMWLEKFT